MDNQINWLTEGVELPELNYELLEKWLSEVAQSHSKRLGKLTYIFCDDARIIEVNREFLQHDYYTDIITFDYCTGKLLRGDMFISLDTVRSNAELVGATYENELLRVIVHGLLHLCGINDKGPGEREIMEKNEDSALMQLQSMMS